MPLSTRSRKPSGPMMTNSDLSRARPGPFLRTAVLACGFSLLPGAVAAQSMDQNATPAGPETMSMESTAAPAADNAGTARPEPQAAETSAKPGSLDTEPAKTIAAPDETPAETVAEPPAAEVKPAEANVQSAAPEPRSVADFSDRMDTAAALVTRAGDAQGAIAAYLAIQEDHPEEIRPVYNLARLYTAVEEWQKARDWFTRYRDHPAFPEDRRAAADTMIADLEELIANDADPERRKARRYEGALDTARARLEAGDLQGAFQQAEVASDIDPERPEAYALAAGIFMQDGDCDSAGAFIAEGLDVARDDAARDLLKKASEACAQSADYVSRTTAARKAFSEERYGEAASLYAKIAADFPEDTESAMAAASAHALASEYGKAAEILTPLAGSEDPAVAREAGDKLASLSPFLRPVAPDTPAVANDLPGSDHYARGLDALKAGETEEARILFDEAIRQIHLSAEMADYFLGRGRARGKLGEVDAAIADYRLASLLDPTRGETHVALASMLVKANQVPQALAELSAAIKLEDPKAPNANLRVMRGRLFEKTGDHDSAFNDYRAAVKAGADPRGILKAYHARAVALAKEGDLTGARRTFERGAEIGPYKPITRDYQAMRQVTYAVLNRSNSGSRTESYRIGDWDGDWIREKWQSGYSVTNLTYGPDGWTIVVAVDSAIDGQRIRFADAFPKDDIKEAWDEGFYVDQIVTYDGKWVLVASERAYGGQSWMRRDKLHYDEVLSRLREKGAITDLSYSAGTWVMINSRGSGISDQKVETGTSFPQAAIAKWIGRGYALTQLVHGNGTWWAVFSKGRDLGSSRIFSANHLTGKGAASLKKEISDGWKSGLRNLYFAQITADPQ
jgi:tetratricopeptide (TPR) repeat protein